MVASQAMNSDAFANALSKPLDENELNKVLQRLKSFPQLNQVAPGPLRREQIGKVKAALSKVTIEFSEIGEFPQAVGLKVVGIQSTDCYGDVLTGYLTGSPADSARSSTESASRSSRKQVVDALLAAL